MNTYKTKGVCSREINFEVEDNIIKSVSFIGGCNGNLKGIGVLAIGMDVDDYIAKCEKITCGNKPTSCPAQFADALKAYKNA